MERMDMAHVLMVRAIGNRLFLAPLEEAKIHRILDIGTGTGICKDLPGFIPFDKWLIQMQGRWKWLTYFQTQKYVESKSSK